MIVTAKINQLLPAIRATEMKPGIIYAAAGDIYSETDVCFFVLRVEDKVIVIDKDLTSIYPINYLQALYVPYPGEITLKNS